MALSDSPSPPLAGVRAYMRRYPYGCFEQRLSKAVALDDRAAWAALVDELPAYTDRNGLLRYWPGDVMPGSVALTAYALSITSEAGFDWPKERKERLIEALKAVVDGRLSDDNEGPGDMRAAAPLGAGRARPQRRRDAGDAGPGGDPGRRHADRRCSPTGW